jgi:hypothetical protein
VVLSRCAPNGKGELLSTEEIAGRVIAAKGFDTGRDLAGGDPRTGRVNRPAAAPQRRN